MVYIVLFKSVWFTEFPKSKLPKGQDLVFYFGVAFLMVYSAEYLVCELRG